jgi:hypothetical protein
LKIPVSLVRFQVEPPSDIRPQQFILLRPFLFPD